MREKLASRIILKNVGKMPIVHGETPNDPPEDLAKTRSIDTLRPSRPKISDAVFWYSINLAKCLRTHRQNGDKAIMWRVSKPTPKQNSTHCEDLRCHHAKSGTGGCPIHEKIMKATAQKTPLEVIIKPIQLPLL